jgi:hypothetical protein
MAKHGVHTDPLGKHTWTAEGGHCVCGQGHAETPLDDPCPQQLPLVVLRCRCGQGANHAEKGEHCPQAEIDVGASYAAAVDFQP